MAVSWWAKKASNVIHSYRCRVCCGYCDLYDYD
jgi:hypothetical protein